MSFPDRCKVNKFIPKKTFYEKIGVSSAIKDEFINDIENPIGLISSTDGLNPKHTPVIRCAISCVNANIISNMYNFI